MPAVDIGIIVTAMNNASSGLQGVSNDVKSLGENAEATANRLKAIQVVIAGIVLEKTLELGKAFVSAAAAVQNIDARMAAWAGSQQKAQSIMQQFNDAVGASGISLETLGNAFVKLRSSGLDNNQAVETIENLANGMAALGGGDINSNMDAAATAFQRFASKGVVSMRELNMIVRSTGLTVGEISSAMGVSVTQFSNELKDKTMSSTQLLDAFNKAAHDKFGDFASLLSGTVSGSLSKFKNDMELALGHLGENTGASTAIAATIQAIDKAVQNLAASITKADVDRFVNGLLAMIPVAANVISSLYNIAVAILNIGVGIGSILGRIPPEATEYGIIGYALFGKVGLVTGTLLGAMDKGIRDFGDKADDFMIRNGIAPKFFANDKKNNQQDTLSALAGLAGPSGKSGAQSGNAWADGFVANIKKMIPQIEAQLDALSHKKLGASPHLTEAPQNNALGAMQTSLQQEVQTMIDQLNGKIAEARDLALGDSGAAKIDRMKSASDAVSDAVQKIVDKARAENAQHGITVKHLQDMVALAREFASSQDLLIAHQQVINDLDSKKLQIEQAIKMAAADKEIKGYQTDIRVNSDPASAFLGGMKGGSNENDQAREMISGIQEKIAQYQLVINEAQHAIANSQNDPAVTAQATDTIAKYQQLIAVATQASSVITGQTLLETNFFKELGSTINNDVASSVKGLITGTQTWHDVGTKLFGDLIDMATKYIEKLIEMQIEQSLMSSGGGTGSSGGAGGAGGLGGIMGIFSTIASIFALANGGVATGGITPFANGGITTGPTLFGLMGEAGTEAVMPLTRIGGKLGVHAAGGGAGNQYAIHVHAIDTQSGLQFIGQHIQAIDAGLQQNRNMNSRAGNW